jgi:hypothetical protein
MRRNSGFWHAYASRRLDDLNGDRPEDAKNKKRDRSATTKGGPGPERVPAQVAYCCIASAASSVCPYVLYVPLRILQVPLSNVLIPVGIEQFCGNPIC